MQPNSSPQPDSKKPRVCAKTGCGKPATHFAGLIIRHKSRPSAGMQTVLDLVLCPEHAKSVAVDDLVTDESWAHLCRGVVAAGKLAPTRRLTETFVQPIDEAPEVFRGRYEP